MRHGQYHLAHRNTSLKRSHRRRMQLRAVRRSQHKKRLIFFMQENAV